MESDTTRQFWRLFRALPSDVQQDAQRAYRQCRLNPPTPVFNSRNWKAKAIYIQPESGLDYRALAVMKKDRIVWFWIGSHADYDRLV